MKFKTAVLWWLVNLEKPPFVERRDTTIEALVPLVETLFPGINYFSSTSFGKVVNTLVIPALRKQFPELLTTPAESLTADSMTEVVEFLPSQGYEWQYSESDWRARFDARLSA